MRLEKKSGCKKSFCQGQIHISTHDDRDCQKTKINIDYFSRKKNNNKWTKTKKKNNNQHVYLLGLTVWQAEYLTQRNRKKNHTRSFVQRSYLVISFCNLYCKSLYHNYILFIIWVSDKIIHMQMYVSNQHDYIYFWHENSINFATF